jgi:hypothetical protein
MANMRTPRGRVWLLAAGACVTAVALAAPVASVASAARSHAIEVNGAGATSTAVSAGNISWDSPVLADGPILSDPPILPDAVKKY